MLLNELLMTTTEGATFTVHDIAGCEIVHKVPAEMIPVYAATAEVASIKCYHSDTYSVVIAEEYITAPLDYLRVLVNEDLEELNAELSKAVTRDSARALVAERLDTVADVAHVMADNINTHHNWKSDIFSLKHNGACIY